MAVLQGLSAIEIATHVRGMQGIGPKPGNKILAVVRGDKVLLLRKPKSYHAAIRGLARGKSPEDYLQKERQSWE